MTKAITFLLITASPITSALFLVIWLRRGFDAAWSLFETFVTEIVP